jgi:dihydroorotase
MLVDNEVTLEKIFSSTPLLMQWCIVRNDHQNLEKYKAEFGEIFLLQRTILSEVKSLLYFLFKAIALKTGARLHVFHLSTAKEMDLFTNKIPLEDKKLLPKFVFTIFGLPMMIMLLRAI